MNDGEPADHIADLGTGTWHGESWTDYSWFISGSGHRNVDRSDRVTILRFGAGHSGHRDAVGRPEAVPDTRRHRRRHIRMHGAMLTQEVVGDTEEPVLHLGGVGD